MNERIRELATEVGISVDYLTNTKQIVLLEKFAELIVRECLGCCEQVISDPVPKSVDTWLNGGEQCIQEIKEHFGLGMSVEDKKQLIKDLLGVSNDTKS
jgi:hypothetical protein